VSLTIVLTILVCATPAVAQGHRGAPPGKLRQPPKTEQQTPADPSAEVPSPVQVRTFGVWLDDATLAAPGSVWLTASLTRWAAPVGSGLDAPAIGAAIGLTSRAQWSLSVPYARFSPDAGAPGDTLSGLGTVYAGVKLLAIDPATHRIGVSTTPAIEILDRAIVEASDDGRAHWVLPLSFEAGRGRRRMYGSVGYFTRGSTFAAGALEARLSPRLIATVALMQSWSTSDADAAGALGLSRRRTDVSGGLTMFVAPTAAVFASLGRTISRMEFDGARVMVTAGLSVGMMPSPRMPPRLPR
jgi:hypothetical protein